MREEVEAGARFLAQLLMRGIPGGTEELGAHLATALSQRYHSHWYPAQPARGQAYRYGRGHLPDAWAHPMAIPGHLGLYLDAWFHSPQPDPRRLSSSHGPLGSALDSWVHLTASGVPGEWLSRYLGSPIADPWMPGFILRCLDPICDWAPDAWVQHMAKPWTPGFISRCLGPPHSHSPGTWAYPMGHLGYLGSASDDWVHPVASPWMPGSTPWLFPASWVHPMATPGHQILPEMPRSTLCPVPDTWICSTAGSWTFGFIFRCLDPPCNWARLLGFIPWAPLII